MNTTIWMRRGSEAEAADRAAGYADIPTRGELESILASHFEADLSALTEEDQEEAIDAMVSGYLGGAS